MNDLQGSRNSGAWSRQGSALVGEVLVGDSGPTEAGWHSIEAAFRCLKEYQFGVVRGLHEPAGQTPDALAVGSLTHAGRARWFTLKFATGPKVWESIEEAVDEEATNLKLPISLDARRRALHLLNEFVAYWSMRPRPQPIATEYKLGPSPLVDGDAFMLWRTAKPDDVSRYPEGGNGLWLGDCKTTSADISDTVRQYELSGQMLLMAALWKRAPQGEQKLGPIRGVMLDIIRKPYGKERCKFARVAMPVGEHALEWFIADLRFKLRQVASVDWNAVIPRTITSCTRMVGRMRVDCPFKPLCRFGRGAGAKYVLRDGSAALDWKPSPGREMPPWL